MTEEELKVKFDYIQGIFNRCINYACQILIDSIIVKVRYLVSVSAILSCRPFFILIFLRCIKMKHYGFSRKSIWKNLETFP